MNRSVARLAEVALSSKHEAQLVELSRQDPKMAEELQKEEKKNGGIQLQEKLQALTGDFVDAAGRGLDVAGGASPEDLAKTGPAPGLVAAKGTEESKAAIAQHLATALAADREDRNHEDQAPLTGTALWPSLDDTPDTPTAVPPPPRAAGAPAGPAAGAPAGPAAGGAAGK